MNVSFTVVASGSNLNYQWQNDSGDLPGSMAATLDVINVMEGDAGEYRCVVSNAVGSVMSMAAQLSIRKFREVSSSLGTIGFGYNDWDV